MKDSYAILMKNHIESLLNEHDTVNIITEEDSYDLLTELQAIPKLAQQKGFQHIAIITDSEHAKRTRQLIEKIENFPLYEILEMEEVLTNPRYTNRHSGNMKEIITHLHNSPFCKFWKIRETIARKTPTVLSTLAEKTR